MTSPSGNADSNPALRLSTVGEKPATVVIKIGRFAPIEARRSPANRPASSSSVPT